MSLLSSLKASTAKIEEVTAVITGIRPAGKMRWDKETKQHVERKDKAADTLVNFRVGDNNYMLSCYAHDVFPKGYPAVGAAGIPAVIGLKENKVAGQPANISFVRFDYDNTSERQFHMITLTKQESFD